MLIHQTLFHYRDNEPAPTQSTRNKNPHIDRFTKFAIQSIQAMDALRLRGLVTKAFHWLPFEIMFAVVLLVCATRKQKALISPQEIKFRRDNILVVIAILDELASRYGLMFLSVCVCHVSLYITSLTWRKIHSQMIFFVI
jgi:hypothetical protein